ncbi:hypothetical protein FQN49_006746 [Arthroderma sp. PD_2]|nr:hypothetical protein FQN49_006746 [Arthroderma sp. PD_2]
MSGLAYAELYMGVAAVIRNFGKRATLYETDIEDVKIKHDCFLPLPKADTKGIRVLVDSV